MSFAGLDAAQLLIDGELVGAQGGATYGNINPATEEVIGEAADASFADVVAAIGAARRAFDETNWSTDVALRVRSLRQLQDALEKHAEPFKAMTVAAGGVCFHSGQGCATLTRLLLPRSRFEEGVELAAQAMASMPYGDPTDPVNVMGPLISAAQRDRVENLVERAKAAGGTPVIGGRRPPHFERGYFYEPTLFADLGEDDEIVRNEVFGPVLVALPYEDENDAVRMANDSIYGLSGGVFSGDHEHSKAVARRIRAGTIVVDGGVYYGPDIPFGGYKQSGVGREMGRVGFEEYLELKTFAEPA